MEVSDWVTAGAASLAALLSLMTLIITGRRAHVSWTRDVLVSAFVDYLSATYRTRGALKHMAKIEAGKESRHAREEWRVIARDGHDAALDNLSRIRVLAGDEVAEVLRDLQEINNLEEDLVARGEWVEFETNRPARKELFHKRRSTFIRTAHYVLKIKPATLPRS